MTSRQTAVPAREPARGSGAREPARGAERASLLPGAARTSLTRERGG